MNSIPVDELQKKTSLGVEIRQFRLDGKLPGIQKKAHRHDHYIFYLLTSGTGQFRVDNVEINLIKNQLYYVLPSQVYYKKGTNFAEGWFVRIDVSLIQSELRDVFEHFSEVQIPKTLDDRQMQRLTTLLNFVYKEYTDNRKDSFNLIVVRNLLQSFLAIAADFFLPIEPGIPSHNRSAEIARQFRTLLTANIHHIKRPSVYASMLNISLGYLNETLKKVTGATVSYWIKQELFSESKRLLEYSNADVKQIAVELGFTDYAYFIRSFRKLSGFSPLSYRKLNQTKLTSN